MSRPRPFCAPATPIGGDGCRRCVRSDRNAGRFGARGAIVLFPFAPFAARIWALRNNLTCYDAWYVALAEALDCPLVTLDGRLARAAGPECRIVVPPWLDLGRTQIPRSGRILAVLRSAFLPSSRGKSASGGLFPRRGKACERAVVRRAGLARSARSPPPWKGGGREGGPTPTCGACSADRSTTTATIPARAAKPVIPPNPGQSHLEILWRHADIAIAGRGRARPPSSLLPPSRGEE